MTKGAKVHWAVQRGDGSIEAQGDAASEDEAITFAEEAALRLDSEGKTHYVRIGENEPIAYNLPQPKGR